MTHKQAGLFIAGCATVLILSASFSLAPQIATGVGLTMTGIAAVVWVVTGSKKAK